MFLGGLAFFLYAWFVAWLLVRHATVRKKLSHEGLKSRTRIPLSEIHASESFYKPLTRA